MNNKWFQSENYEKVIIKKLKSISDSTVIKEITLQDPQVISFLKSQVEKNATDGKLMISFAPESSYISVEFVDDKEKKDLIEIHAGRLKTPSTGFNSSLSDEESKLISDVESLFQSGFSVPILKVINNEYNFTDLKVTYLGKKNLEKARSSSAALVKEHFQIKGVQGDEQILEITSGQRPPEPVEFKVNGKKYKLITYENEQKFRLYPYYFEIIR